MTVHALLVGSPGTGPALAGLVDDDPTEATARLEAAALRDAAAAVAASGGELLVNHPDEDRLAPAGDDARTPREELRGLLEDVVPAIDDVRFEVQVGDSFEARAAHVVTHLLEQEGVDSVAVLDGRAPTLDRTALDQAAMKLRRSEVVLGPAAGGRVAYAGFASPVDLAETWSPPEVATLASRGVAAGHDVDFLPVQPHLDDPTGPATLVSVLTARRAAGRRVPAHTATAVEELGLQVVDTPGGRRVATGEDPDA